MKKFYFTILSIFLIATYIFIYNFKTDDKNSDKPIFLCSTSLIADAVKELAGEWAKIICIMGPGIDPHLYKASSHDAYNISEANIIFYNGLHLEGKMADIFTQIKKQGKNIYAISDGISKKNLIETEYKGIYDPHIWHDVVLWQDVVTYIYTILINHYPEKKESLENNYKIYLAKLINLQSWVEKMIHKITQNKVLISSHDAFSYFAKRYNILFYSVQGISTDAEATVQDTERVLNIILQYNVPTIFIEHTVSENYLKNIQSIISLKGKKLKIGDALFSDALGETEGKTYIDMIEKNVSAIVSGLNNND